MLEITHTFRTNGPRNTTSPPLRSSLPARNDLVALDDLVAIAPLVAVPAPLVVGNLSRLAAVAGLDRAPLPRANAPRLKRETETSASELVPSPPAQTQTIG